MPKNLKTPSVNSFKILTVNILLWNTFLSNLPFLKKPPFVYNSLKYSFLACEMLKFVI